MIRVEKLVKVFGAQLAVAGLDLRADPGDILGLIGPNGAGKTTTLRILATLEQADGGQVEICGHDLSHDMDAARRLVGFMPERFGLYDELTVRDYLEFFGRMLNLSSQQRSKQIESLIELCDLKNKADESCGGLSKGVRQRLYLAKTLLADPPILLLDEPASGLDPRARIEFRELIRELANYGKTVVISSHILSELDVICNRVLVVEKGRAVFEGETKALETRLRTQRISLSLLDREQLGSVREILQLNSAENIYETPAGLTFEIDAKTDQIAQLLKKLIAADISVYNFSLESRGLESLFLEITKGIVS